uniref:Uncharacterized protein n=1 Tax=Phlebotomus papatasi TaxID=29031 RepID=A0A1B0DH11_PHLPP
MDKLAQANDTEIQEVPISIPTELNDSELVLQDIAAWPIPVGQSLRISILNVGSERFQNSNGPFEATDRAGDYVNGNKRPLMTKTAKSNTFVSGFNLWWKLSTALDDHERS